MLADLTDKEAEALLYDWNFWARPNQLPPPGDWFVWLLRSGRGFGKTRTGAEWVRAEIESGRRRRIALVGQSKADVRDTMIELGDSALLNVCPPWNRPVYESTKRRVVWPNGGVAIAYSGDEPDQLRGPQHDGAWVDELAKFRYPQGTWDNLELGLRLGSKPQAVVTSTPRPIPIIKRLLSDTAVVEVRGSTYENVGNLSPRFFERVRRLYEGTRLGRQELYGEVLDDVPGALWQRDSIERGRVRQHPQLLRVVVAVDPEASSEEGSAETGIVVAGRGADGHGYVLDDRSLQATPHGWASAAVTAYHLHHADRVIGEVNNGGEMVGYTVATVDPRVPFKAVHASRGKAARAEPVAALYEQGRVHHVGCFAELEDQMCSWLPGEKSPDRMDALVWALTELFLEPEDVEGLVTYDERVEISAY